MSTPDDQQYGGKQFAPYGRVQFFECRLIVPDIRGKSRSSSES
ncbi:MAG TPA: hypothetical protein VF901_22310 [Bradyrhizobium sp.]